MSQEIAKLGFSFIWAIENFSHSLESTGNYIESSAFKIADSDKISWSVLLYPRGFKNGDNVSCYLKPKNFDSELEIISAKYSLSLLSADGKNLTSHSSINNTFKLPNGKLFSYGLPKLLSRQVLLEKKRTEYLPEDTLTVCCRILSIDSKEVDVGSSFARTRIGVQKTSFIWSIENFSKLKPDQKSSFILGSLSTQMDLFFTGSALDIENIQIEISQLGNCRENVSSCTISLLDANGETVYLEKDIYFFDSNSSEVWKFPDFITKSLLLSNRSLYLPRDVLTLRCKLAVSAGVVENKLEKYGKGLIKSLNTVDLGALILPDHSHTLIEDMKQLYNEQNHSDVSLQVGNVMFPVHKNILSARSPIFSAMFETEMMENRTGVVHISDLDEDTVRRMLIFFYTDTVEDLQWKDSTKLYTASNKYDIPQLMKKCSSFLLSNINQSNVVELLILADMHTDGNLKEKAVNFILGREKEIFSSEEWSSLIKYNSLLAAEIAQQIFLKK